MQSDLKLWQAEKQHRASGPSLSAADECFMRRREHSQSLFLMWATQNQRHLCRHTSYQLSSTRVPWGSLCTAGKSISPGALTFNMLWI